MSLAASKWQRITLIAVGVLALTVGVLYEASTHVVRGWLRGEAFYDGRPTSYWRVQCDEYIQRFDDDFDLQMTTWLIPFEFPEEKELRMMGPPAHLQNLNKSFTARNPPSTTWTRMHDAFRSTEEIQRDKEYFFAPAVLRGAPDTQSVLEELAREEKYKTVANVGLERLEQIHGFYAKFKKEVVNH